MIPDDIDLGDLPMATDGSTEAPDVAGDVETLPDEELPRPVPWALGALGPDFAEPEPEPEPEPPKSAIPEPPPEPAPTVPQYVDYPPQYHQRFDPRWHPDGHPSRLPPAARPCPQGPGR